MGSRERKRAELARRKRRAAQRAPVGATPETGAPAVDEPQNGSGISRSELRNQQAREALEPLRQGERPTVVTVGAVISAVIALIFVVSAVIAVFSDAEVNGSEPSPLPLALFAAAMIVMAVGMFRARYWAVLGFQALLLLILLAASLGLVGATTLLQLVATVLLIAGAGALFYFMVKALARIQMPQRLPRAPRE